MCKKGKDINMQEKNMIPRKKGININAYIARWKTISCIIPIEEDFREYGMVLQQPQLVESENFIQHLPSIVLIAIAVTVAVMPVAISTIDCRCCIKFSLSTYCGCCSTIPYSLKSSSIGLYRKLFSNVQCKHE